MPAVLRGQDEPLDTGSRNPLVLAKQAFNNELGNSLVKLSSIQRISLIKSYDRQIRSQKNELPREEYLDEMTGIAGLYWENRAYDEATETYLEVAAADPDSLRAANAYMMSGAITYGNRMQPENSIRDLVKSVEILKRLNDGQVDYNRDQLTARVVSTLGDVYMITGRDSLAAAEYRYLLENDNVLAAAEESAVINANLEWARILFRKGQMEQAMARYRELDVLARDSGLSTKLRIALSMESWDAQSRSGMNEKELVFFLEELWMDEREHDEMAVLYLGNNLSLFYYFSKDKKQNAKFAEMAQDLLEKAKRIKSKNAAGFSEDEQLAHFSIVQQTRLMQANLYERRELEGELADVSKRLAETRRANPDWQFSPFVPTRFPREIASTLSGMYRKYAAPARVEAERRSAPADARSVLEMGDG